MNTPTTTPTPDPTFPTPDWTTPNPTDFQLPPSTPWTDED